MSTESAAPETATASVLPTGTWKVDPVHSSVEFQVKHLGIATVKGLFKEFEGTLEIGPDGAQAYGTVQTASVDTREPARDEHLRSADFFEVASASRRTRRSTARTSRCASTRRSARAMSSSATRSRSLWRSAR